MFKKILAGLSATTVFVVSANATTDFHIQDGYKTRLKNACNYMEDVFFNKKTDNLYYAFLNQSYIKDALEAPKSDINDKRVFVMSGKKFVKYLAEQILAKDGIDLHTINYSFKMRNGITYNINGFTFLENFYFFTVDYLPQKLQKLSKEERFYFLEKFILFTYRTPINVTEMLKKYKNKADIQALTSLIATYITPSKYSFNTITRIFFSFKANAIYFLKERFEQPNKSSDLQVGAYATNIDEFIALISAGRFNNAFNLINKTYSNKYVDEVNKELEHICKINVNK